MDPLEEIFELARDLPEEERESFLTDRCGRDIESLNKLRELLAAADEADKFFPPDNSRNKKRPKENETSFELPSPDSLEKSFTGIKILKVIGQGGMGAVYKARQIDLDREVAIKILPPETSHHPGFAERFRREAQAMARLDHQNIVTVHEFGQTEDGLFFIIMSFVDGASLAQVMKSGKLPPEQALGLVSQLCDALQYAHNQGVVHRDIKPGNILLSKTGQIKVADFGIAKLYENDLRDTQLTRPGMAVGTPDYIAPEQTTDSRSVDHRADIYSIGVVFYQMLTGEIPRGVFDPPSSKNNIDPRLDTIVLKAMKKEPDRRYQQASEIKTDIGEIQSTHTSNENKPSYSKRKALITTAGLASTLIVVLVLKKITADKTQDTPEAKPIVHQTGQQSPPNQPEDGSPTPPSAAAYATKEQPFVNSLGMKFVPVPITGTSTKDKTILFCIWETRVQDYRKFAGTREESLNPKTKIESLTSKGWGTYGATWKDPGFQQSETDPVVCVSFLEACQFADWLSKKEGLQYRLPSDHEWSCAVGIGNLEDPSQSPSLKVGLHQNIFPWGANTRTPSANSGNYAGRESIIGQEPLEWEQQVLAGYKDLHPRTAPVGSYLKNKFGIYDLGGNVWEWCQTPFEDGQQTFAVRGASWENSSWPGLLSSFRDDIPPWDSTSDMGFRIVLEIPH